MVRHLLSLVGWNRKEVEVVLELAIKLKTKPDKLLQDKILLLLFEKPSTRTRVSFEVAMAQLGGRSIYMDKQTSQLARGESLKDTALVLSRYVDFITARVFRQKTLEEMAKYASIPVINALSDMYHPCQALGDMLTIWEKKGRRKLKIAFVGDGNNNVTHSLMLISSLFGHEMWVASPPGYEPNGFVVKRAIENNIESGGDLELTNDPVEAVKNADVVYTDVWVSMGRSDVEERLDAFKSYQVNSELVKHAKKDFIFMHCLPAHVGQEVTKGVIYGKNSVVFDQAENRLHAQKGLLVYLSSL